jgi:putative DNA primase/helicase
VERDTDPARLKVNWSLTAKQQLQLGAASTKAYTRHPNRDADGNKINGDKGEAVEVFHNPGRQVVILGEHVLSGGSYLWPDGHGPEAYAPIPPAWWEMAMAIVRGDLGIGPEGRGTTTPATTTTTTRASRSSSAEWAPTGTPADPCPICGRNTTGYCSRNKISHTIRCFHGITFSPEISHGNRLRGEQITGTDGVIYGYSSTKYQPNGDRFSVFRVHQERPQQDPFADLPPDELADRRTAKEQEAVGSARPLDEDETYQVLGWCPKRESVWYRHRTTAQIAAVKPSGQAELLKLAPLTYWEAAYPIKGKDGNVNRCDWGMAASALIEAANLAGVFEPEQTRGRGVWEDNGRIVWHLGDHLEVDGQKTSLTEISSVHYYALLPALSIDRAVAPLDDEHGCKILQVLKDCNWQRPADHLHLAGFVVLSNVCGALRKRPGLQVTSPYGSGKSDTIENTINPLQAGLGRISTGSTEAGIRQLIGRDALPCTVDESEAEDGNKREAQLRLVRYSFDGVPQVKGTPSGEPIVFCLRSSLALAGINAPITNPADLSRMAVISRATLPADRWAAVSRQRAAVITVEIGQRLIRRTVSYLPTLLANIATFGTVISGQIGGNESGRAGDTYGALLAGAHHLTSTKAVTEDEAQTWLDSVGWSFDDTATVDTDRTAGAEGRQCLEYLLANEGRWVDPGDRDGPGTQSLTVRELVSLARNSPGTCSGQAARIALGRKGIHAVDEGLAVARSAPGTQAIFGTTKWRQGGHTDRLLEIDGSTRTNGTMRFPKGGSHRAVVVPWAAVGILGEE